MLNLCHGIEINMTSHPEAVRGQVFIRVLSITSRLAVT